MNGGGNMTGDNGLGIFLTALPAPVAIDFAQRAEQRGFQSAWFPEITFADAFGPATAAGLRTQRILLGTGVVGIWSRSPVTLALQAATLHQLSGERLLLGVGVQARGYVRAWHGQEYRKPVTAMREFVTTLRAILSREPVSFEGEIFSVRNFQLFIDPPARAERIYVAANGVPMIETAAELADGMLGYFHSAAYVRDVVLPAVRRGLDRAGRSPEEFDVACGFPSVVTRDDSGIELAKGQVVMYATALGSAPAYADSVRAAGFEREMLEIQERVAAGDIRGAVARVPDSMADALTLSGNVEHVRERIEEYRAAGLGGVMLNPSPPGGWFPLYEGHFPEGAEVPPFDFPAFLEVVENTVELLRA